MLSLKSRPFVYFFSFFDMRASRQPPVFLPFFLFFFEMSLFPSIFEPLPFSVCMESKSDVVPLRMVFFYLVTTSWIFDMS